MQRVAMTAGQPHIALMQHLLKTTIPQFNKGLQGQLTPHTIAGRLVIKPGMRLHGTCRHCSNPPR